MMDIRSLSRVPATRATRNFLILFWVTYSLYEGAFGWIFWANIYLSLEKFSYYRQEFFHEQSSQIYLHILLQLCYEYSKVRNTAREKSIFCELCGQHDYISTYQLCRLGSHPQLIQHALRILDLRFGAQCNVSTTYFKQITSATNMIHSRLESISMRACFMRMPDVSSILCLKENTR